MKKDLSKWSMVIAGRWNTAILSPQWLGKEVFHQPDIGIMFPVIGFGPPIFQAKDIRIVVTNESVIFVPLKDSPELLTRIEEAARHILKTLRYTPILAFGENFCYTVEGYPSPLTNVLKLADAEQLSAHGKINEVSLVRTINLETCQLNLKLIGDGSCRIELNYHYPAKPESATADAMEKLMENTYTKNHDHGLRLLETVYNLTLEEDDNHDNKPA